MYTRLNIEKLDGNIVQKHRGSKQVGFKQLGPGVETGVHGVSNDDTTMAQRRLEDKQHVEKINTNCLVKEQEKEYQTRWKIKTGNVSDSCNQRSTQQCMKSGVTKHLGVAGIQQQNRSPSSAIGFKTPIDMLGFFGWLASIKQGMLEPVKVKCIFLGYRKGTGLVQVLQGVEFEVQPHEDHTFEVEPHRNVDHVAAWELFSYREDSNEAAFAFATVDKIYAHESLTFNNTVACDVISMWKAGLKDDMDTQSDVYVLSNGCRKCSDDGDGYYWEYTLVQTLLKGHSTLSLEDSLSGDCDVEKNRKWSYIYAVGSQEYQVVCMRPDIASVDVDMLDGFDHRLQTNVQVFVDFDYAMGRSITVMSRSITGYGLMILGCA
ncbi:hypothetical protein Tco_0509033 [Tanacetum coccineum]